MTPSASNPLGLPREALAIIATALASAIANTLQSVQEQVKSLNAALKANYLTTFANWAQSVLAGRLPATNPPQPPNGYVVGYFNDPTTGPGSLGPYGDLVVRWPYPAMGDAPVCDVPPLPSLPTHELRTGKVGTQQPSAPGYFNRLDGDTTLAGKIVSTTSADGIAGDFLKIGSPFGSNPSTGEVGGVFLKVG